MYDESKSDSCTITVIATGLEDKANSVVQNRLGGGVAFRQPASHMTPSSLKGMNIQSTALRHPRDREDRLRDPYSRCPVFISLQISEAL
jgi:hypothetical protein